MNKKPVAKYFRSDLETIFGLTQPQMDKSLAFAAWRGDLPVVENFLDKRKIYTDETIEYFQSVLELKIVRDPESL